MPIATPGDVEESEAAAPRLIRMALSNYDFRISKMGDTFAIPRSGPKLLRHLQGGNKSLLAELARKYFREFGKTAPRHALTEAMMVLEGIAQEIEPVELNIRSAQWGSDLWLDLGDLTGRVVRINREGWKICDDCPVLFKRTALTGALPEPTTGFMQRLWDLINVEPADRSLLLAWLVSCLFPDVPSPVLALFGEQGTAKTTCQKMLVKLLDPGPVVIRKPPRDPETWITAAAGSLIVAIDNLSTISSWLSDSICRAVTGEGDVRRKLYTDSDYSYFSFRRCICLNGIDLGAIRGDLGERLLPIQLEAISEQDRREDREIWEEWSRYHAEILAALLDLTVKVLGEMSTVKMTHKPRMADFARILATIDSIHESNGLNRYIEKQREVALDSLSDDPFVIELISIQAVFTGSSAQLLAALTPDKKPSRWPRNAREVTQILKRNAPALRKAGWSVTHDGARNMANSLKWIVAPPETVCNSSLSCSLRSPNFRKKGNTSDTSTENAFFAPKGSPANPFTTK